MYGSGRLLSAVIGVTVLLAGTALADDKKEPEYKGIPLSKWVEKVEAADDKGREEAFQQFREAVSALGPAAKPAVPSLIRLLNGGQSERYREIAATLLGMVNADPKDAVPALTAALTSDKSNRVRDKAVRAIVRFGADAESAFPALVKMLIDQPKPASSILPSFESEVELGFRVLGTDAKAAVPDLVKALESLPHDDLPAARVCRALAAVRPDAKAAMPAVVATLRDKKSTITGAAAAVLGAIGPDAKNALPDLLPHIKLPQAAAAVLRIDPKNKDALPVLLAAFKSESNFDEDVEAALLIDDLGPLAKDAVPVLLEMAKDRKKLFYSVRLLGRIGPAAKEAIPWLTEIAKRPKDDRRYVAIAALGDIGPQAKDAIPALTAALAEDGKMIDTRDRMLCAAALARVDPGNADAMKYLIRWLRSTENGDRQGDALMWLSMLPGPVAKEAVPDIVGLLRSENDDTRQSAAAVLKKIDPEAAKKAGVR